MLLSIVPAALLASCLILPAAGAEGPATQPARHKHEEVKPLAIGAAAPEFDLPGVDGKRYSLRDFKDAKVLVIVFTSNHCPTAQAYEQRIMQLYADYKDKGIALFGNQSQ